jgi:hypothetical protein
MPDLEITICDFKWRSRGEAQRPGAFTEHGALMAATVLHSARAIEMSLFVVRAFLQLRDLAASRREFGARLAELERRVTNHDDELKTIVAALRKLIAPPGRQRRAIGFSL